MKSVIYWTIWARRRSTIGWSLGVFALVFINLIFYPSFKNDADELQKSFENLPDAALQLLGGSTDFFSPIGFLNSQIFFLMLPLLLLILAIGIGSSLLAKEEQEGTIELLLARPLSRSKLLAGKALAGWMIISIVTFVGLLSVIGVGRAVDLEVPVINIIAVTLVCYLLTLSIAAIAFCISALGRARKLSLGLTSLIALGGYLISSLSGTVSWLSGPSKLFPFSYYQSESILREQYNWANTLFFIGVILLAALVSWFAFNRRDISNN